MSINFSSIKITRRNWINAFIRMIFHTDRQYIELVHVSSTIYNKHSLGFSNKWNASIWSECCVTFCVNNFRRLHAFRGIYSGVFRRSDKESLLSLAPQNNIPCFTQPIVRVVCFLCNRELKKLPDVNNISDTNFGVIWNDPWSAQAFENCWQQEDLRRNVCPLISYIFNLHPSVSVMSYPRW